MEFRISINEKHLVLILASISVLACIGLVVAYGTSNPSVMGHTWGEIECSGCITSADIGDGQVASADLADNAVTTAKIADGQVTNAKIASMDWGKITTGVPSGLSDGDDDNYASCNWPGAYTLSTVVGATQSCSGCCTVGTYCAQACQRDRIDTLAATCTSAIVTAMTYTVGSYGTCYCPTECYSI